MRHTTARLLVAAVLETLLLAVTLWAPTTLTAKAAIFLVGSALIWGVVVYQLRRGVSGDEDTQRGARVALSLAVKRLSDLKPGEWPFQVQNVGTGPARFVRVRTDKIGITNLKADPIEFLPPGPIVRITGKAYVGQWDMADWEAVAEDLNWFSAAIRGAAKRAAQKVLALRISIEYEDSSGNGLAEKLMLRCSVTGELTLSRH